MHLDIIKGTLPTSRSPVWWLSPSCSLFPCLKGIQLWLFPSFLTLWFIPFTSQGLGGRTRGGLLGEWVWQLCAVLKPIGNTGSG